MEVIEKSAQTLELDKVLNILASFAKSTQSREKCLHALVNVDYDAVKTSLGYTKEAKVLLERLLELPIEYIANIDEVMDHRLNSYLDEYELINVAKTIRTARLVRNFLKENTESGSLLNDFAQKIVVNRELEDNIFSKFDDANGIRKDATNALNGYFSALKDAEKEIKAKITELLNNPEFAAHLQETIYTIRDNRVVFPVMSSDKSKVSGITHDFSATNKTVYIEPSQIVPMNNKIRELKSKINAEIVRILTDLTKLVKSNIKGIKANENLLSEVDFHFAKARYAIKIGAVEPELTEEKVLLFEGIKHPLIISKNQNLVENDFELGKTYKSLIITGSNTGGKTVTLKTVGLFVLMTRIGMFLPCKAAKLYPFKRVLADIGDEQSILQSLSTFSAHMTNIIDILNLADNESLVLLDELCAGTDPQEGAVLAETILSGLATKEVLCVTTTHFGELKTLEYTDGYYKNACVEFDKETLKPTYKLTIGIPGASNAIFIASNLGLPRELVEKATETLHVHRDPSVVVIEKLQETQRKLSKNLYDVECLKSESQRVKDEYEQKMNEIRQDKRKTVRFIENKFSEVLDNVKLEVKEILSEVRSNKSEKSARRAYNRLAQIEQGFRGQINELDIKQSYDALDWSSIKVGDTVMIKDLNQPVVVKALPDKNNNLIVQMGMINTKVDKAQIVKYDKTLAKKPQLKLYSMQSSNGVELKRPQMSNTLDLRGYNIEDALDSLEVYLDKASLANLTPVYIIHGHGTGILKKYIRDYVSTSPYVAKFRVGENAEGGDGVTVVDLN